MPAACTLEVESKLTNISIFQPSLSEPPREQQSYTSRYNNSFSFCLLALQLHSYPSLSRSEGTAHLCY